MKHLIAVSFLAFAFGSFGQSPYIVSIEILPQYPTTNDEVFLATHVETGNLGQYAGSVVGVSGSVVTVESCYNVGWSTQPQTYFDTISIGYLNIGTYNLNYTCSTSSDGVNCDQGSNNRDTSFIVQKFVSIDENAPITVDIYPNPTKMDAFRIKSPTQIKSIELINHQGCTVPFECTRQNENYSIQLKSTSKGSYLILLTFETGETMRKRISVI